MGLLNSTEYLIMTFKLITSNDTAHLHGQSYETTVMVECLDKLFPEEKDKYQYLSKAKIDKLKELFSAQYVVLYFVDSYTHPVQDYHDNDGDYTHSDSETQSYKTPTEEMIVALKEMGYNDTTKMMNDAVHVEHDINLYYGERISLESYCMKI